MRKALVPGAVAVLFAAVLACGSDSGPLVSGEDAGLAESGTDSGSPHPDGGNKVDGGPANADAGPVAAPFGLDVRPANTTCVAAIRPVVDTGVTLQRVWSGLNFAYPVALTQAPGNNDRWYVVGLSGKISTFLTAAATDADASDFANINVTTHGGEAGLLGIAFHPDWQAKHEVYLSYTRDVLPGDPPSPPGCPLNGSREFTSIVARYKSVDNGLTVVPTADEIFTLGQPYTNHNGGNIQFSPVDKMLYIGFGDGGFANDPCGSGQDLKSPLGKMLRIDVNAGPGKYSVPKDNPFFGSATTMNEIWAYGLRNPWRWSFDSVAGDLWVGDVGQSAWEEIDRVVSGGNYGWNVCEGFHKIGSLTDQCDTAGLLPPVVEHGHGEAQAIVGGFVYRGSAIPSLVGTYIYGDYAVGNIWAIVYDANNTPKAKLIANVTANDLSSFGQGNDGEIYTVELSGVISKLVPAGPPMPDNFPKVLSQTGCTDPKDARKPSFGMIAYDVNSPLWSDGAAKERWLAIPDGKTITVGSDGDFDLPIGSVAMKQFSVGGKRIETRLFMRHDDGGWAGYTYEWNDAETEATLLPGGKVKPVNGGTQQWTYPSRSQCKQCHSAATGGTIGLQVSQLNRTTTYVSTNRVSNELATLEHIGMFTSPLPGAPSTLPALPVPSGVAAVDARARSYLHSNCSHCHQPGGTGQGTMDLRYPTTFHDTQTCNATNTQGAIGSVTNILTPGSPAQSIMSLRIHATDGKRMPALAVSIPDPTGTKLLDQWITGLPAICP